MDMIQLAWMVVALGKYNVYTSNITRSTKTEVINNENIAKHYFFLT